MDEDETFRRLKRAPFEVVHAMGRKPMPAEEYLRFNWNEYLEENGWTAKEYHNERMKKEWPDNESVQS